MGVHALAQRRAGGDAANTQGAREERITAEGFNGVKVIFTMHQQTQVAFEDVAIGDTFAREGKLGVDALVDSQAFEVLADERQAGVGGQLVGQLLIMKSVMSGSPSGLALHAG